MSNSDQWPAYPPMRGKAYKIRLTQILAPWHNSVLYKQLIRPDPTQPLMIINPSSLFRPVL